MAPIPPARHPERWRPADTDLGAGPVFVKTPDGRLTP
ncbi:hypothetical protein M2160_001886 [Streptomyces sp. SAI-117]|nr:hypothetical protein [Streptomyces sp. SAI-117]